jgi:hypothetical protein
VTLGQIVEELEGQGRCDKWPVSDLLHLLKSMRMRLGRGDLVDGMGGHPILASGLESQVGPLRGLENLSPHTAMSDIQAVHGFST